MRNTVYSGYLGPRISRKQAKRRIQQVIDNELTDCQRRVMEGYYKENKNIVQLAQELGVNKSTVWRTLKRGEDRLQRFLKY